MTLLGFKAILHKKCRSGKNSEGPAENSWVLDLCTAKWKQISKSLHLEYSHGIQWYQKTIFLHLFFFFSKRPNIIFYQSVKEIWINPHGNNQACSVLKNSLLNVGVIALFDEIF
jgi:hypothetical protein